MSRTRNHGDMDEVREELAELDRRDRDRAAALRPPAEPIAEPVELPALRAELERVTEERDGWRERCRLAERERDAAWIQAISGVTKSPPSVADAIEAAAEPVGFEQRLETRTIGQRLASLEARVDELERLHVGRVMAAAADRVAPAGLLDAARWQLAGRGCSARWDGLELLERRRRRGGLLGGVAS